MTSSKKHSGTFLQKLTHHSYKLPWDWLYLRCHLVFAMIVFVGMLVFIWWVTS